MSPNPAIDRSVVVPDFRPFEVNRATNAVDAAGGKGVNAARAVKNLRRDVLCAGFLGGESGQRVAQLANMAGLDGEWTWIEGETRTCTLIIDPNSRRSTVVNESGPTVTAENWKQLGRDVMKAAGHAECICVCGSAPPGTQAEFYADFLHNLQTLLIPVWVDASGMTLRAALTVSGIAIKVNDEEIGALVGEQIKSTQDALGAAKMLREQGAISVIVTLGAPGAVIAHEDGQWWAKPPIIKAVSGVGSGDSFTAGFAVATSKGETVPEALRWATAAGAANALSIGPGQFEYAEFEHILAETTVISL
ncbi:MAG: 1-phosphofructokinase family hexose kinase [Chloroflexota bacterium]